MIAVNVRSLSSRLSLVLSWGFDLLIVSEARVAKAAMKCLARVARASGYDVVFGPAPPPSPTFDVSPGGLAVISKLPISLRRLHPPELDRWDSSGRVVVVQVVNGRDGFIIVAVYGYPLSHVEHGTNESLLTDSLVWSGKTKAPVLMAGDFNETIRSSPMLAAAGEVGMRRVSPNFSSTMGKVTHIAKRPPIDHAFVSKAMWCRFSRCSLRYDLPLADHFPLLLSLFSSRLSLPSWSWPRPPSVLPREPVKWVRPPQPAVTFVQWSEQWRKWLEQSYGVSIQSKIQLTATPRVQKVPKTPPGCLCIQKAYRSALHNSKLDAPRQSQVDALARKLFHLSIHWDKQISTIDDVMNVLSQRLTQCLKELHAQMLKKWKGKVWLWSSSTGALHNYVRNDLPSPPLALCVDDRVVNHPLEVAQLLNEFWFSVESWPAGDSAASVWDEVEDSFAIFLPHHPCSLEITPERLYSAAQRLKKSTHGPDGWSVQEVKRLPVEAWTSFYHMYVGAWRHVISLKRRTPLEKSASPAPSPRQVRPIDVFSILLRLVSSVACANLRSWTRQITHSTQTATHGGISRALACLAVWTESVILKASPVFAISVDLSLMFNMLSVHVSEGLAQVAGLSQQACSILSWPILSTDAVWRLPGDIVVPRSTATRGLPQGLATSVLYAELNIACLIRKLHVCCTCHTIAYVDDLHIVTADLQQLVKCVAILMDFVRVFRLCLSSLKSALWGTFPLSLQSLSAQTSIAVVDSLEALGATWNLTKKAGLPTPKEERRADKVRERLLRICHLPAHPALRSSVVSSTALSLIDYLSPPNKQVMHSLRPMVRKAIGHMYGAPEIVFNATVSSLLDPVDRGFLTLLRLWVVAAADPGLVGLLESPLLRSSPGRFGALLKECTFRGISLDTDTIRFESGPEFRVWAGWTSIRKGIVLAIKDSTFAKLQLRRPGKFAGPFLPNWKAMRRLYASLSPKDAVVLLRVWAGAAMTASHRHTIDSQESALCSECQCEETVAHLMWHCPLHEQGRPLSLAWWHTLPPAASQSLLCPREESASFLVEWRRVCLWGVKVLTRRRAEFAQPENEGEQVEDPEPSFDSPLHPDITVKEGNGHLLVHLPARGYAFCARCFIARKARDAHFVLVKPCANSSALPLLEGDYCVRANHVVRMIMAKWKTSSLRPKLVCVKCGREQWATAQFKSGCAV